MKLYPVGIYTYWVLIILIIYYIQRHISDETDQYKYSRIFPISVEYLGYGNYDFNNLKYRYMLVRTDLSQNAPWNNEHFAYIMQFYYQQATGILQIAFGYEAPRLGIRNYHSGMWTTWKILEF